MPTARYIESLKNPRIPGFEWQEPEDEGDRKMFKDILEHGCQVIAVQADAHGPDFSYSVGLYLNFICPEILIMGMSSQACHKAINQTCREAAAGKKLDEGGERSDLFDVLVLFGLFLCPRVVTSITLAMHVGSIARYFFGLARQWNTNFRFCRHYGPTKTCSTRTTLAVIGLSAKHKR